MEPLSALVTAICNGTTATQNQAGLGLPVTRIETISKGSIDYSKVRYLNLPLQDVEAYQLRPGDILFSHINSVKHIGKIARYDGARPLIHGMNLMRVVFDQLEIEPCFGYYLLSSSRAKRYFENRAKKAINQASLNRKDIGAFPTSVPPLPEQRKIAAIFSSVDDAIEKTQAVIDQVQVVKRGLMQELLTRGLPGRHTRFKQSEIGKIPADWQVQPLVDACTGKGQYGANVSKRDFKPGGIRYVRITDVSDDGTLRDKAVGISDPDATAYLLQAGDVLFARSGATVGKAYLHREHGVRCAFAGYLIRFKTDPAVLLPAFLRAYVDTITYWRWVADRQRAQAQPNINAAEYGQLPVPCPPIGEQQRVTQIADSFNSALMQAHAGLRAKRGLKHALMSALLTGELRVTPDPDPA